MSRRKGWIGVDLDGTLAQYGKFRGVDHIGEPVPAMVERVKRWLSQGKEVRIFTARVAHSGTTESEEQAKFAARLIVEWCEVNIGRRLPVTCMKDFEMWELWDDRTVQVEKNTGRPIGFSTHGNS